jgi:hypothetical protein
MNRILKELGIAIEVRTGIDPGTWWFEADVQLWSYFENTGTYSDG